MLQHFPLKLGFESGKILPFQIRNTVKTVPYELRRVLYFFLVVCTPFQCEETLYSWLLSMVSCWVWSDGYQLAESGDSLDRLVSVRAFETYCA